MSAHRDQFERITRLRATLRTAGLDRARHIAGRKGMYHVIATPSDDQANGTEFIAEIPASLGRRRRAEVGAALGLLLEQLPALLERAELAEIGLGASNGNPVTKAVAELGSLTAAAQAAGVDTARLRAWIGIARITEFAAAQALASHTSLSIHELTGVSPLGGEARP